MIRIRQYREGDEKGILKLRRRVFGDLDPVRLREETWHWQFRLNPAGEAFCAVAEDRGRIIGQYAAIPTRFRVKGEETRFAFSCDTMIHPRYRRQGLFTDLAREVYRFMETTAGITTVWGFPNRDSLPGFTGRLGWHVLKVFPLRLVPLRPLSLVRALLPGKTPPQHPSAGADARKRGTDSCVRFLDFPGLSVEPLFFFGEEFEALWHRHGHPAPVVQVRDPAYLNWRYLGVRGFGYQPFAVRFKGRLSGYIVIRTMALKGHFFGILVDLFPFPVRDPLITRRLVGFAREYCRVGGAEFMTCLMSRADRAFYRSVRLIKVPALFTPRPWYFGARYAGGKGNVLAEAGNWHLTYGDADIV